MRELLEKKGLLIAVGVIFLVAIAIVVVWFAKGHRETEVVAVEGSYEATPIESLPPEKPPEPESCTVIRSNPSQSAILDTWNGILKSEGDKSGPLNRLLSEGPGVFLDLSEKVGEISFQNESPCAPIYSTLSKKISSAGDPVLEIDKTGRTIGKWQIPFESEVVGIRGGDLFVKVQLQEFCTDCYTKGTCEQKTMLLKVGDKGDLSFLAAAENASQLTFQDCPKNIESKSEFNLCLTLPDDSQKKERWLVVQGPCT